MRLAWRRRWFWLALAAVSVALPMMVFGHVYATRAYFEQAAERGRNTLGLAVAALRGQLGRYEKLPELLADNNEIVALVAAPDRTDAVDRANRYLKTVNALLESSDLYVMLVDGTTLAASNFDGPASFVGENFSYRPYFQNAVNGGQGRFYALGTTSLKRGYYFGAPIRVDDEVRGVMVIKLDIDAIESAWRGGDYEIIVTDPEGIIFMSGRPEWLFTGTLPLTPERLERTIETRRYADTVLRELPIVHAEAATGHDLFSIANSDASHEYLAISAEMPEADWSVRVLVDTRSARAQAFTTVTALVLMVGLAAMGAATYLQRRARMAERLHLQHEAREQLERRVAERTTDLATVNRQLNQEVAERRAAEQQLRKTQSELIQAGKLAALGQMSAALSHEFNQPLAAVRTYADNATVLIDRNRIPEARESIDRIAGLVDRLASISRHLRNFARKPNEKLRAVSLTDVVEDTRELIAWRLRAADIDLVIDLGSEPIHVRAGSVRLQQVLVNIISNAADAVEGQDVRQITLTARRHGRKVEIVVRDSGPGVAPGIAERIFDPFFTTKGVNKGLGLGLSISYNIIKDFRGEIVVSNHPDGGAQFTITLESVRTPVAEPAQ
jgi:two-component system C4-dicarboxylate transport sensor histidine kinase DctB